MNYLEKVPLGHRGRQGSSISFLGMDFFDARGELASSATESSAAR